MEPCFNLRFLPSKTRRRNQIVYVVNWQILLRKSLAVFLRSDSVELMRFATEAVDDGAAQSRPETVFLFVLP
jgi:hypothetical protein